VIGVLLQLWVCGGKQLWSFAFHLISKLVSMPGTPLNRGSDAMRLHMFRYVCGGLYDTTAEVQHLVWPPPLRELGVHAAMINQRL
jgi:hypothetical protein